MNMILFDISAKTRLWTYAGFLLAHRPQRWANINPTMVLCLLGHEVYVTMIDITIDTRRWTNDGLMLGHRLRRWPNIKPPLFQRLVIVGSLWGLLRYAPSRSRVDPRKHDTFSQCCFNVGPPSTTLAQQKTTPADCLMFAGISLIYDEVCCRAKLKSASCLLQKVSRFLALMLAFMLYFHRGTSRNCHDVQKAGPTNSHWFQRETQFVFNGNVCYLRPLLVYISR